MHGERDDGGDHRLPREDDRLPRPPEPLLPVSAVDKPVTRDELVVSSVLRVQRQPDDDQQDEEEGEREAQEADDVEG